MSEKPKNPDVQENNIDTIIEKCINKAMEQLQENNNNADVITEIRVDKELNRLREQYETGLKILNHTNETRWKIITICTGFAVTFIITFFSLFFIFVAPDKYIKPYIIK